MLSTEVTLICELDPYKVKMIEHGEWPFYSKIHRDRQTQRNDCSSWTIKVFYNSSNVTSLLTDPGGCPATRPSISEDDDDVRYVAAITGCCSQHCRTNIGKRCSSVSATS